MLQRDFGLVSADFQLEAADQLLVTRYHALFGLKLWFL
jgi:hypothetical protein